MGYNSLIMSVKNHYLIGFKKNFKHLPPGELFSNFSVWEIEFWKIALGRGKEWNKRSKGKKKGNPIILNHWQSVRKILEKLNKIGHILASELSAFFRNLDPTPRPHFRGIRIHILKLIIRENFQSCKKSLPFSVVYFKGSESYFEKGRNPDPGPYFWEISSFEF